MFIHIPPKTSFPNDRWSTLGGRKWLDIRGFAYGFIISGLYLCLIHLSFLTPGTTEIHYGHLVNDE